MATLRYSGPTEKEVKENTAAWIRNYLERNKESQADLSARLGVSEPTISNIVSGTLLPGFKVLVRLHFGIGAPLNEVMRFPAASHPARHAHTQRHRASPDHRPKQKAGQKG